MSTSHDDPRKGWVALVRLTCCGLILLAAATLAPAGGPGQGRLVRPAQDQRPAGLAETELRFIDKMKRQMFSRPDWWPYENGVGLARYGDVDSSELSSPDVLITPKGAINVKRGSQRDNLPADLRAAAPATGKPGYYIVQFAPSAASGRGSLELRKQIGDLGGHVVEYVPNNAFLVKIQGKDRHNFDNPSQFQYVTPYEPADKISPKLGRMPLLNPERAVSDTFSIVVQVMPGESADDVASDVQRLGGTVTKRHEVADTQWVSAELRNNKVIQLAKNPAVKWIYEAPENVMMNLVTSAMVEVGRFLEPREFGDFVLPYRNAGIDGSGIPMATSAADKDFTGGSVTGFDSSLSNYEVAPQFLGVADNGLTLDSPAFAHDNSDPCVGGACMDNGTVVTNVGPTHRKVEAYIRGVSLDATAAGDFLTCDGIRSGGVTHGTLAAGGAAANPSGGINGLGREYSDVDSVDLFVAFFNDTRESNLSLDGQARGSRVIFEDIANTPPSSPPACAVNFLSDVDAGNVPADRLADMAYRRDLNLANNTLNARGAKVTLFAFGNPVNFDDIKTNGQGNYTNGANGVDAFLFANRRVLHVQPVGNDGSDPQTGADIDPLSDPNFGPQSIQVNDLATAKNIVTVGSNTVDDSRASTDNSEIVANFTSKGPATYSSLRVAPLVVAPGVDIGGGFEGREGRFSDYYFVSMAQTVSFDNANDTTPTPLENVIIQGQAGTSISAGKIAGAALQIRDYFAKGFYPTAEADAAHRIGDVSGMLVKALLINSTDFPQLGPPIASCAGKFCNESGYGKVELANTLPLTTFRIERRPANKTNVDPIPSVPPGLLVADEYFDGGARGAGADGSTTGIGVVPVGGSVSFDFYRRDGWDQVRASLAWYDAVGETLKNDLDLEVISGDYELTDFGYPGLYTGYGICSGYGYTFACGECTYAANDNDPSYFDASGLNPYVIIWRGNNFREFSNQFSLHIECDPNTGAPYDANDPAGPFPQNTLDTRNPTEQVVLHYFGDPAIFGASRSGGDHGPYRVRVKFKNTAGATPVPNAPCVWPNVTLHTAAAGDDTVLTANGVSYIGTGADGLCNTAASGGDAQLIPQGSFGQPFGLAVAGPIYGDHVSSTIALNRQNYDCSEKTLSLSVADGSVLAGGYPNAVSPSDIGANTIVESVDPNGVVQDTEGGFGFRSQAQILGGSTLRAARYDHYVSDDHRLQFTGDRPGSPQPIPGNGIIEVKDGWTLRAVYADTSPTRQGGPAPDPAVTEARVICQPFLGEVRLNVASGEPMRRTNISGGCDTGRVAGSRGDLSLDAGEDVVYQVGFANQNTDAIPDLRATLSCSAGGGRLRQPHQPGRARLERHDGGSGRRAPGQGRDRRLHAARGRQREGPGHGRPVCRLRRDVLGDRLGLRRPARESVIHVP